MSDPKYNKYAGTVRFDDDNIVDIDLQPDTENIRVLLNGSDVTGGGLPVVDSSDNGDVLTVVEGSWAKAAPAGGNQIIFNITYDSVAQKYVSDLTNEQILNYAENSTLTAVYVEHGFLMHYHFCYSDSTATGSDIAIMLAGVSIHPDSIIYVDSVNITAAGDISFTSYPISQ